MAAGEITGDQSSYLLGGAGERADGARRQAVLLGQQRAELSFVYAGDLEQVGQQITAVQHLTR